MKAKGLGSGKGKGLGSGFCYDHSKLNWGFTAILMLKLCEAYCATWNFGTNPAFALDRGKPFKTLIEMAYHTMIMMQNDFQLPVPLLSTGTSTLVLMCAISLKNYKPCKHFVCKRCKREFQVACKNDVMHSYTQYLYNGLVSTSAETRYVSTANSNHLMLLRTASVV
jgi:hypothetical protein